MTFAGDIQRASGNPGGDPVQSGGRSRRLLEPLAWQAREAGHQAAPFRYRARAPHARHRM